MFLLMLLFECVPKMFSLNFPKIDPKMSEGSKSAALEYEDCGSGSNKYYRNYLVRFPMLFQNCQIELFYEDLKVSKS